uniref:HMA domain-containing protein n=1 Tax=Vitis vinifera TaxID=29760 RepID=F6I1G8_VITVI
MAKEEKIKEEKVDAVTTAVYKVNLHCRQCAREIQKPLLRAQAGIHKVDADIEAGEIRVKGLIHTKKIQERIEKLSKKKVEIVSPQAKIKDSVATEKTVKVNTKEVSTIVRTTTIKVHMHCEKCEHDLRRKLLRRTDIYSVKTDMKAQKLTVEGTVESDKLIGYIRKKVHKHAEIIAPKPEKEEEKKEDVKVEQISITTTQTVEFMEDKSTKGTLFEGTC